jgi:hypothetical protein
LAKYTGVFVTFETPQTGTARAMPYGFVILNKSAILKDLPVLLILQLSRLFFAFQKIKE